MKRCKLLAVIAVSSVILMFFFACNGKPDLVVSSLQVTGPPVLNAGAYELPIRVVVNNQGSSAAGVFKVSVEYTGPGGTFAVSFTVPGQPNIWYPYTTVGLAAGNSVTFDGKLTFHPSVNSVTVTIKAIADSCGGDEFMPGYCRVDESNEANNKSTAVTVVLP
jgi:hypothetical protein